MWRQTKSWRNFGFSPRRSFSLKEFGFGESLPLEGSVARDHLANERTFLAWARTSLVFLGSGIGLHQLYQFAYTKEEGDKPDSHKAQDIREGVTVASGAFIILGFGILTFSSLRYFSILKNLKAKKFRPNTVGIASFSLCTMVTMSMALFASVNFPEYVFSEKNMIPS